MIPNNIRHTLAYIRSVSPKDTKKTRALRFIPNRKNAKQLLYLQYVRERGAQISYKEFDPDYTRKPSFLPERYTFGWVKGDQQ